MIKKKPQTLRRDAKNEKQKYLKILFVLYLFLGWLISFLTSLRRRDHTQTVAYHHGAIKMDSPFSWGGGHVLFLYIQSMVQIFTFPSGWIQKITVVLTLMFAQFTCNSINLSPRTLLIINKKGPKKILIKMYAALAYTASLCINKHARLER